MANWLWIAPLVLLAFLWKRSGGGDGGGWFGGGGDSCDAGDGGDCGGD